MDTLIATTADLLLPALDASRFSALKVLPIIPEPKSSPRVSNDDKLYSE